MTTIKDMTIDDAQKHFDCTIGSMKKLDLVRKKLLADAYEEDWDIEDIPETTWKAVECRVEGKYTVRYKVLSSYYVEVWIYVSDEADDEDLADGDSSYSGYPSLKQMEKEWKEELGFALAERQHDVRRIMTAKKVIQEIKDFKLKMSVRRIEAKLYNH